jgi:hypothetical protein
MDENSSTFNVRDKFLAASSCLILLMAYMILAIMKLDTKFIEGAFLVMIGVLGGLLKSSPSPTTTTQIEKSATTNVNS